MLTFDPELEVMPCANAVMASDKKRLNIFLNDLLKLGCVKVCM